MVAQAVRAHVQACFDRESELLDALKATDGPGRDEHRGGPAGISPQAVVTRPSAPGVQAGARRPTPTDQRVRGGVAHCWH